MDMDPVLDVRDLRVTLWGRRGAVDAVRGVDLTIRAGEAVAVVGESGCGKSTLGRAIIGLVDPAIGRVSGEVRFLGDDFLGASERDKLQVRGRGISMVFQDPNRTLDPVFSVGYQLRETLRIGPATPERTTDSEATRLIRSVEVRDGETRLNDYPHQFSGGERQRLSIALGVARQPDLLIADEPTTALDSEVQEEILALIADLVRYSAMSLIFITHDLEVAHRVASRIAVMYAGQIVELGPTEDVLGDPQHPYTIGLMRCDPRRASAGARLQPIPGELGDLSELPPGCSFAPRCDRAIDRCQSPQALLPTDGRSVRCHLVARPVEVTS